MNQHSEFAFIENMTNFKLDVSALEIDEVEYEIIAAADFVGDVSYGPYRFTPWDMGIYAPGERRSLCFCINS